MLLEMLLPDPKNLSPSPTPPHTHTKQPSNADNTGLSTASSPSIPAQLHPVVQSKSSLLSHSHPNQLHRHGEKEISTPRPSPTREKLTAEQVKQQVDTNISFILTVTKVTER